MTYRGLETLFFEKTTQIVSEFFAFQFFKGGKFATFSKRPKAKSVSCSAPGPPLGAPSPDPYYRGLTLVFGGPPTL